MAERLLDWKRFWCARQGTLNLSDDGFLVDPDQEWARDLNPDVRPFEGICDTPALVLLGEPGIGKSTAVERECDAAKSCAEHPVVWRNLRAYHSDSYLHEDVFSSPEVRTWAQSEGRLTLFLDSLDECRLSIPNIAAVLANELERLPCDRLNIRIACRTADWMPTLEEAMRRLWGDSNVKVYELAPLRRIDVELAARSRVKDPGTFMAELLARDLVPLAIKPISLKFLLSTYIKQGTFPDRQVDLYRQGCQILCEEGSQSRRDAGRTGTVNAERRLEIAAWIAAATILCGRSAIWTGGERGDVPDGAVAFEEIQRVPKRSGLRPDELKDPALKETLNTGLFSSRGQHRIGWAHQTYGEFLAARFLAQPDADLDAAKRVLTAADGRVVPQLQEVAAWLAAIRTETSDWLLKADPEVLLLSDTANLEASQRKDLVQSILDLHEQQRALYRGFEQRLAFAKLNHPGLHDQLFPYITDKRRNMIVRRVAMDICALCQATSLRHTCADRAGSDGWLPKQDSGRSDRSRDRGCANAALAHALGGWRGRRRS